jgi:hypothetical protein
VTDPRENHSRHLRAIIFADVVGYSRLMQDDEDATQHSINELLAIFEQGCAEFDGEIMDVRGDGIFALFASTLNSIQFAVNTQQIALRNRRSPFESGYLFYLLPIYTGSAKHDNFWVIHICIAIARDPATYSSSSCGPSRPGIITLTTSIFIGVRLKSIHKT